MNIIENIKEQDQKQKILLAVFVLVLLITVYVVYTNFIRKPKMVTVTVEEGIKPLNLNLRILDSEVFNNLKNN